MRPVRYAYLECELRGLPLSHTEMVIVYRRHVDTAICRFEADLRML